MIYNHFYEFDTRLLNGSTCWRRDCGSRQFCSAGRGGWADTIRSESCLATTHEQQLGVRGLTANQSGDFERNEGKQFYKEGAPLLAG